ncbi:MAG: tagaturonate epimerase family protein [Bryobacteraceae bacterium]
MTEQIVLGKNSIGVGDRFAHQGKAQLRACMLAAERGVDVIPVWNKSNREHLIIGSGPVQARAAADAAVRDLGWTKPYYVDADHIHFDILDRFLDPCDFYTIDVADWIGWPVEEADLLSFISRHSELAGDVDIPGIDTAVRIDREFVESVARKYLAAVKEAARIFRKIEANKGEGRFITEVSMDETDSPQSSLELLIVLAAIADEKIPIQTIAPKFTGRFNKGVDYEGDLEKFQQEFSNDVAAIEFAIERYGLPANLKLSVHSGSDKFSIYPAMREILKTFNAGVHLKTAGTTWLEELIGLAEAGGDGLETAKQIYAEAYSQQEELSMPYAAVIDIDANRLPKPNAVHHWSARQFVSALKHDPANKEFNSSLRQLLHVGFKVAARMGSGYLDLVSKHEAAISRNVTENLFERHIRPVFIGD